MINYKLANILLEHNDRFFQYPDLYYKSSNPIVKDKETGANALLANTAYDFATYFNSFSNRKWREYTIIDNSFLHLEVRGKAQIELFSMKIQPVGVGMDRIDSLYVDCDEFESIDYELPATTNEIIGFKVITQDRTLIRNGYYYTKIDESVIRSVHLALSTTTFKKEDYIRGNVALFKNEVLKGDDPVAGHVSMIVVDNGRTLDPAELRGDNVYVYPNKNVGGSGGFARGMMEAKRISPENPVTHVLIMDDDISLSSESVKRTYNLLALVKDKYVDGFISGAMFSRGDQYLQIEDLGFTNQKGRFGPIKRPRVPMTNYFAILQNEKDLPIRPNKYAAFWYCCIPMTTIMREGLPLPLFIRYDDAEYGQRCKPEFMTMNGICVWHDDFDDRYNHFYERYCGVRNSLVIQAASGVCQNVDFFGTLFEEAFIREIKKYNYGSCELMLDAVEDFLKGPEFLEIEQCEKLLKEKSAKAEKFIPLEDLDIEGLDIQQAWLKKRPLTRWQNRASKWTHNGQRVGIPSKKKPTVGVAAFDANAYAATRYYNFDRVLVVNRLETMGYYAVRDSARYRELIKRFEQIKKRYAKEHAQIEQQWREAAPYLKSDEFWSEYLELDSYQDDTKS